MKKLAIAMLLSAGSGLAQADYKLVNADGSALSQLCIAAVVAPASLLDTAANAGISATELHEVRCNGINLSQFAHRYGKTRTAGVEPAAAYVLKGSDESAATALCIAAASSEQEFRKVKATHFGGESSVEAEVFCNGLPLKSFARKYRKPAMIISQR